MPPEIKSSPHIFIPNASVLTQSEVLGVPEPIVMHNNRIPFPEAANASVSRHRPLETLVLEMAATDPKTFLHSVMVTECYARLRTMYVNSNVLNTHPKEFPVVDAYLRSQDTAALLHDIGKWTITDDVRTSVAIVNSPPSDRQNPYDNRIYLNGRTVDHRNGDEKSTHKLHPLTGVYTILALAMVNPLIPEEILKSLAKPAGGHHEHFFNATVTDRDGKLIPSYPRRKLRFTHDYEDISYLLLKMADTAVAMGRPRAYRDYSLTDEKISESLDHILTNYFSYLGRRIVPSEKEKQRKQYKEIAIKALKYIQSRYSEEICRDIAGFTDTDGQPYPPKHYQDAFLLGRLAKHVWKENRKRLEEVRNGTIFTAPLPQSSLSTISTHVRKNDE